MGGLRDGAQSLRFTLPEPISHVSVTLLSQSTQGASRIRGLRSPAELLLIRGAAGDVALRAILTSLELLGKQGYGPVTL